MKFRRTFAPFSAVVIPFVAVLSVAGGGCSTTYDGTPRAEGDRTPLTLACGPTDDTRCILPFPSNHYAKADATSPTSIRVAMNKSSLLGTDDEPSLINRAEGFSRVQPVFFGAIGTVDPVLFDQAGFLIDAATGAKIPQRTEVVTADDVSTAGKESLLVLYPLAPYAPKHDYIGVVTDDATVTVTGDDGVAKTSKLNANRALLIALDRAEPASQEEADLRAHYAPTRAALKKANIDLARVVRLTEFTTREAETPKLPIVAARKVAEQAVVDGKVTAVADKVTTFDSGPVLAIVRGHLSGVPKFTGEQYHLTFDAAGKPIAQGVQDAPFRVMIPRGTGDYRMVFWGHGAGGNVDDDAFDADLALEGAGKSNYEFDGWTDKTALGNITTLVQSLSGSHGVLGRLLQSLVNGAAMQKMLETKLGDLLAADTLGPQNIANPAKGRRPNPEEPIWAGGSLGGIVGSVVTFADPTIRYGAFNVPAGGWAHFLVKSIIFDNAAALLSASYGTFVDLRLAIGYAQTQLDGVDSSVWADVVEKDTAGEPFYILQESIDDPVVPNIGTAFLGRALRAKMLTPALQPIVGIEGVERVDGSGVALAQYQVPFDPGYGAHGFAACNTPAGKAARAQITRWARSCWDGKPTTFLPAECNEASGGKGCDFRSAQPRACN